MSEVIPYCRQELGPEEIAAVTEVLESGWIARGPRARAFEEACAARLGASHTIACANGSVAIEIALRGLGIGPGDDVVVPTLTWVATAMAVRAVGARPIFCDIDPATKNLTAAAVEEVWTENTRCVIAVDFAGVPHDLPAVKELVREGNAYLIEDAAHAFGAWHATGAPVGADGYADATTFSFHPAKTITTAEGGMVTTADPRLAERMQRIRSGGIQRGFVGSQGGFDYQASEVGSNHHMTELSAALGLVQLGRMDEFIAQRKAAFTNYGAALGRSLDLPVHPTGSSHNLYIVQLAGGSDAKTRNRTLEALREKGVAAHVHYPLLHRQPFFEHDSANALPVAEDYFERALTLPLFPSITPDQIERVATALHEALAVSPLELTTKHAA